MKLSKVDKGMTYIIKNLKGNEEINSFLFTLGCFEGEKISVIKKTYSNLIVNIKGVRYGIDNKLADTIEVIK